MGYSVCLFLLAFCRFAFSTCVHVCVLAYFSCFLWGILSLFLPACMFNVFNVDKSLKNYNQDTFTGVKKFNFTSFD